MRALSVRFPWAELIARGAKRIEWRSWRVSHRGPLLVVASRTVDVEACREHSIALGELRPGRAVCVVDLVDVVDVWASEDDDPDVDDALADFAWRLRNPRRVRPVPVVGRAALFHVDDALIRPLGK